MKVRPGHLGEVDRSRRRHREGQRVRVHLGRCDWHRFGFLADKQKHLGVPMESERDGEAKEDAETDEKGGEETVSQN